MGQDSPLKVFVASELHEQVVKDLAEALDITYQPTLDPAAAMEKSGKTYNALLLSVDVPLKADLINRLPKSVGAVATYSVGLEHIDLDACKARGIAVYNAPGVLSDSVAEIAMFLTLGAARRGTEAIDLIRSRNWPGWTSTQLLGIELVGKTMGIFGMGAIGRMIAERARSFGMTVVYCDQNKLPDDLVKGAQYYADPEKMMGEVDVLILACPSTPETRGFLNEARLNKAKRGIIIVNIARGDLVIDDALIAALKDGRVYAAGLDVFAGEPKINPGYYDLPNLFMLPHQGSGTVEARRRTGFILIDGLNAWIENKPAKNKVV